METKCLLNLLPRGILQPLALRSFRRPELKEEVKCWSRLVQGLRASAPVPLLQKAPNLPSRISPLLPLLAGAFIFSTTKFYIGVIFWVFVSCLIYGLSFIPMMANVINNPGGKGTLGDFLGREKGEDLLFVHAAE